MCFLAVIGCLRPTTNFETPRKDPKLVFQFVKDKISSVNGDKYVNFAILSPWELKHMFGVFAQSLRSALASSIGKHSTHTSAPMTLMEAIMSRTVMIQKNTSTPIARSFSSVLTCKESFSKWLSQDCLFWPWEGCWKRLTSHPISIQYPTIHPTYNTMVLFPSIVFVCHIEWLEFEMYHCWL